MRDHDMTSMGGQENAFLTTHWSLIEEIKTDQDKDRTLIGLLLQRYWKPAYCYVRRKGFANEQAKDLTQGFFHEVVLNRHLIDRADCSKGRFRSLILHALNQYIIDEGRKESALKRIPQDKLVSLDIADPSQLPQMIRELDAEQSFNYVWKAELLKRALAEVKDRYLKQDMKTHWQVFQDRLLGPTLGNLEPLPLQQLCERYGIKDEATASNMINTVKKRVRRVLESHVRQTVASDEQAEEELRNIVQLLKKDGKK